MKEQDGIGIARSMKKCKKSILREGGCRGGRTSSTHPGVLHYGGEVLVFSLFSFLPVSTSSAL